MDSSGVSRSIECDDHEALVVGAWVRTGCWLQPHLLNRLELDIAAPDQGKGGDVPCSSGSTHPSSTSDQASSDRTPEVKVARKPSSKKRSSVAASSILLADPRLPLQALDAQAAGGSNILDPDDEGGDASPGISGREWPTPLASSSSDDHQTMSALMQKKVRAGKEGVVVLTLKLKDGKVRGGMCRT